MSKMILSSLTLLPKETGLKRRAKEVVAKVELEEVTLSLKASKVEVVPSFKELVARLPEKSL